jgi:enoyl-CoA hydratase/carnithine racemase
MTDLANHIRHERVNPHVELIVIDRAEKRNALHSSMVIEIGRLIGEFERDDSIRAVVLTGTEAIFAAGADIKEMLDLGPTGTSNNPNRVTAWRRIENFSKPIIAAVNGVAFGAGNEIAMTCDFIVAGRNAQFGQPEVKIGGMVGDGGTQRLPRKIGPNMAAYMLMTGDPIDVDTAFRLGLVIEICKIDKTVTRAVEIANAIALRAPFAVRNTKACIRISVGATLENGIAFERDAIWRNGVTEDKLEGMRAFTEKRAPVFTGR